MPQTCSEGEKPSSIHITIQLPETLPETKKKKKNLLTFLPPAH